MRLRTPAAHIKKKEEAGRRLLASGNISKNYRRRPLRADGAVGASRSGTPCGLALWGSANPDFSGRRSFTGNGLAVKLFDVVLHLVGESNLLPMRAVASAIDVLPPIGTASDGWLPPGGYEGVTQ